MRNTWVSLYPHSHSITRGCISIGGRCFSCLQAPPATLHPFLTWSTVTLSRRAKDYVYSAEVPPPPHSTVSSIFISCSNILSLPPLSLSLSILSPRFPLYMYTRAHGWRVTVTRATRMMQIQSRARKDGRRWLVWLWRGTKSFSRDRLIGWRRILW